MSMELGGIELVHLLENASEELENLFSELSNAVYEALEGGIEAAIEAGKEFGFHLLEEGKEVLETFL